MHIGHVARRCSMNKQHEKEQGHAYAFLKALAPCCMDLDSQKLCTRTNVYNVILSVAINYLCKDTMTSLCWPLYVLCWVTPLEWVGSTSSTHFLHRWWVGRAWLRLLTLMHTLFSRSAPCILGSRHFPDILSGRIMSFQNNFLLDVL